MTALNQSTSTNGSESCNAMGVGKGRGQNVFLIVLVLLTALLGACATGTSDKDGVPTVDLRGTIVVSTDAAEVAYYKNYGGRLPAKRMVTVEEKQIPLAEFVQAYCGGKDMNQTCARAKKIIMLDASRGPRDNLPAGV